MATLAELTAQIIAARVSRRDMTTEELQQEMQIVSNLLKGFDSEGALDTSAQDTPAPQQAKINFRKIFKEKEVVCLLCNKGFQTLKRHLAAAHQISEKEYRKQFKIPTKQPLVAKAYSEERRKAANERGLAGVLAAARANRAAKKAEAQAKPLKKTKTAPPQATAVKAAPAKAKTRTRRKVDATA